MTPEWASTAGAASFGLVLGWLAVLRGRSDLPGGLYRAVLLGGGVGIAWWLGSSAGTAAAVVGILAGAWLHSGSLGRLSERDGEHSGERG
jgi:hypothetical protein